MGYNLEKLRFVFEILAFRSKMRKHFVLRIIYMGSVYRFVYSLAPAKMPIITFGISLLYTACLLPLVKSLWKSVFSSWKQKE